MASFYGFSGGAAMPRHASLFEGRTRSLTSSRHIGYRTPLFQPSERITMPHTIIIVIAWIGMIGILGAGCSKDPAALKATHLERAERYAADGKYPEAVIEYRNAIQVDPTDANTQYKLGLAYLKQNAFTYAQPAFIALSKAVELDPNLLDAQVKLGELYFLGRQSKNAAEKATLVLEKDPTHRDALLLLANSAMAQNQLDRADEAITNARHAYPNDPKPLYAQASLAMVKKDYAGAERAFVEAARVAPTNPEPMIGLGNVYRI